MFLLLATALAMPCPTTSAPTADTTHGCVQGLRDGAFEAFLGVPYAEPPVGDRRWARPEPKAPWGRLRAISPGDHCPQTTGTLGGELGPGSGVEDCLYLNVVRPTGTAVGADLPILFFTHGGSHTDGSGTQTLYLDRPELVQQDVILVTHNYRLGQLGWLGHPAMSAEDPDGTSANQGLMDTLLALQWVHDNAAAFGGDPDRITIFGESAGSANTCALLTTPASAGLFSGAILQSGPCVSDYAPLSGPTGPFQESSEDMGRRLGDALGCADPDPTVELACMRSRSTSEVMAVMQGRPGLLGAGESYTLVHDGVLLPRQPAEAFAQGAFHRVPVVVGSTGDEGSIFVIGDPGAQDWTALETRVRFWGLAAGIADRDALVALYGPASYPDPEAAYAAFVGDTAFVCPGRALARTLSDFVPTRLYSFERTPGFLPLYGAYHGAELHYIFGTLPWYAGPNDRGLADTMQQIWAWFARGTLVGPWPTVETGAGQGGTWARLDVPPSVTTGVRATQCDFLEAQGWRALP